MMNAAPECANDGCDRTALDANIKALGGLVCNVCADVFMREYRARYRAERWDGDDDDADGGDDGDDDAGAAWVA